MVFTLFQVKIWFQNRRTKWKRQDNVTNSEAAEVKSANSGKSTSTTSSMTTGTTTSTTSSSATMDNSNITTNGKSATTTSPAAATSTTAATPNGLVTTTTASNTETIVPTSSTAPTKKNSPHNPNGNSSTSSSAGGGVGVAEGKRNIANELSAKLTAKQATKIKKQLNALLEKTSKNATGSTKHEGGVSGDHHGTLHASNSGTSTGKLTNNTNAMDIKNASGTTMTTASGNKQMHNSSSSQQSRMHHHQHHRHIPHHHHAIPLTVEPAAPLEQTEKLEIKLEESPQHRELQLTLLRAAHGGQSPHYGEMDFESKLAASKISNALAMANKLSAPNNLLKKAKSSKADKLHTKEVKSEIKESKDITATVTSSGKKQGVVPTQCSPFASVNGKCNEDNKMQCDLEDDVKTGSDGKEKKDLSSPMECDNFIENKNGLQLKEQAPPVSSAASSVEDDNDDTEMQEI